MKHFFLCVFLFFAISVCGQELHFDHFEPSQELPSSETYHILQDRKGYLWFTSDAGICRYDGNKLNIYTVTDGISENVVFNVYEDRHGRIWFSTLSGYFFYYSDDKFTEIGANAELKKLCASHPINSFFIGAGDTLYCTNLSVSGLLKIPSGNNYGHILHEADFVRGSNRFLLQNPVNPKESLIGSGKGKFIGCSFSFAHCFNKTFTISFKKQPVTNSNTGNGICDREGNIYLSADNQLTVIRKKNGAVENYYFPEPIICIRQDNEGDLWIGIKKKGGLLFRRGDLKSEPVHFLEPYTVSDLVVDREGSVWACTLEKGIFQCFSKNVRDLYLPNEKVVDFQVKENRLLAGISSNRILSFSEDKPSYITDTIRFPPHFSLNCLYSGRSGLYYGANKLLFYSASGSVQPVCIAIKGRQIGSNKLIPLSEDTVITFSLNGATFLFKNKILDNIYFPFRIGCVAKLKNNTVLVGSKNNAGIYRLDHKSLLPYLEKYPQLKTRINSLQEDLQGNLWIATNERGIFCVTGQGALCEFNESNGLASNKVNIIAIEEDNTVWAGTNKGLSKLVLRGGFKNAAISNFNKSHGIPAPETDQLIAFGGKIWCGTKEHLFCFDCDKLNLNTINPFAYLKSVLINGKSYSYFNKPVLKYNENNINIEFESITFKTNGQREFLYKLEGYDTLWRSSATGNVQYTNLPHGNYHFLMYALNNDKVKSIQPAEFYFEIGKPFWFYWWCIAIEAGLLAVIVYLIAKAWSGKIRRREAEKTLLNQKMAEFHMTAIRAQMNPHFVFNAISSIQHYILNNDPYESYRYLAKFSLLIRNVLDNSQEEYISIMKEMETLRLYIELEQIRFKNPFELVIAIDEKLNIEENYIPTMLIQPYIENAIWHGLMPKQTDCKLSIILKKEGNSIRIIVSDNGIGREASSMIRRDKQHVSRGMALSGERLDALKVKNGKLFSVRIIDLKDEHRRASGTQVDITIPILEF